jgi:PAS domain S-box-containing protein
MDSREVFERITDAFVALDQNWCYTYMNNKAGEILNRDPEKMIGKHIWTEFPEGVGPPFQNAYQKAMVEQQYVYLEEYYPPYDRWFENHIYPSPEGISIYFRDITEKKKAELRLQENEKQLRLIYNTTSDIIFLISIEPGNRYKFSSVNQAFLSATGLIEEQVIGKYVDEVIPEPSRSMVIEKYRQAIQTCNTVQWEETTKYPAGWKTGIVNITPSFNEIGECNMLVGIVHDITERKKAEEELRMSEERYRALIDQASDAIMITDQTGNFIDVNASFCKMFGYTRAEMLHKNISAFIDPDQLKTDPVRFDLITRGQPVLRERRMIDKNGNIIEVEANVKMLPDGRILAIARNITDRKKAQDEIKKAKELTDKMIDSLPGIFYLIDEEGKYIRWNRQLETISGYKAHEIAGMHPTDFFEEEEKEYIRQRIAGVFMNGSNDAEANIITKDGEKISFYFKAVLVNYEGKPCLLGSGVDISDRKKAEEQLKYSFEQVRLLTEHLQNIREEERTNIAREIHDELGQQLTVMKMDVSWLNKKIDSQNENIRQKIKDLLELLDGMVKTVRRISSELRPSLLDDMGLVAAMEWHLREFEKRAGIKTLFHEPAKELQLPDAIKTGLFRIFQESLTNIGRHAHAQKVNIALETNNKKLMLTIEDDGRGFEKEKIAAKETLGILGMRERSLMMGGSYEITSIPGKGTSVVVSVPYNERS